MAVKRAKKLKKQDFDNVKIIQNRLEFADTELEKLGNLKVEITKKIITSITAGTTPELSKEIAKIQLYIDKNKEQIKSFIAETDRQNVELAKDLQKKYGDGTINPEKGTFIPNTL
jgi:Na+/phosphate symporter